MSTFFSRYKPFYTSLLKLGIPIMIGQLGIIVVSFADNIMVGQHSGDELAAASFVNNLLNLPIIFGMGFSLGLTPIVGSLVGKNHLAEAGHTLRCSLIANFVLGLLLMAIMTIVYFNIENMGQPESIIPLVKPYFLIQMSGIAFIMLFNSFKQFADGMMDTKAPMYILISANLLNIAGNYALIYGKLGCPELGLIGAGISTLISRIVCLLSFVVLFFFTARYNRFREGFHQLKAKWTDILKLVKIGTPIAFQMGMETGSFNLSVIMMGWIGAVALAAHQVVGTFTTIGFMLYYGIGSAITILISNNKGSGDQQTINRIAYAGLHLITFVAMVITLIMFLLRYQIGLWFTDSPEINAMVAVLVLPTMVYQLSDGLQIAYANALRGIEDVKPMAYIAFVSYFLVCLPSGYIFGFVLDYGAAGVWWGFPIGLTVAGMMFYWRFRASMKKRNALK